MMPDAPEPSMELALPPTSFRPICAQGGAVPVPTHVQPCPGSWCRLIEIGPDRESTGQVAIVEVLAVAVLAPNCVEVHLSACQWAQGLELGSPAAEAPPILHERIENL